MCGLLYDVLAGHQRWLDSGKELGKRANLQEADLQWASLQGANLQEADLQEADLRWANLQGASLQGANLQGASLQEADLRWANLQGASLQGASLQGANLQWANLQGAGLQEADLRGANLDLSCLPLSCGGTGIKGDRRLFAQILYHLTRQDWSEAGEDVQKQVEALNGLESINWFCGYRKDLKRIGD